MSAPELDELFRCDHFAQTLAQRHCRRRQLERVGPEPKKGAWEPRHPYCANECPVGRGIAGMLLTVATTTCRRCGAGLVDETRCACEPTPASTGRLFPPPTSTRLWTGEVPDVPIAALKRPPAPPQEYSAPISAPPSEPPEDKHSLQFAETAKSTSSPPKAPPGPAAEPPPAPAAAPAEDPPSAAEEPPMPAEKLCPLCKKKLRSDNASGRCADKLACARRAHAQGAPSGEASGPESDEAKQARRVKAFAARVDGEAFSMKAEAAATNRFHPTETVALVAAMSTADLVALLKAARAELEDRARQIAEALGSAA